MRHPIPKKNLESLNFNKYIRPLQNLLPNAPELLPRGDRPFQMTFEDQIKALIFFPSSGTQIGPASHSGIRRKRIRKTTYCPRRGYQPQ